MHNIATLGPAGTYSEQACICFINQLEGASNIQFYPSIKKVILAIGESADLGVIPIENFSEGYVSTVLDILSEKELKIFAEVVLPIQFSFVSNEQDIRNVEKLFVQFVAKNQCSEFIEQLTGIDIVQTESNMISLEQLKRCNHSAAAVVPTAAAFEPSFAQVKHNIADHQNNQTRFLVVGHSSVSITVDFHNETQFKTSIIVFNDNDSPGALSEILQSFSSRGVNLLSIISRPTRQAFGQYFFYIDLEGHEQSSSVASALKKVALRHRIKVLGSYRKLKI